MKETIRICLLYISAVSVMVLLEATSHAEDVYDQPYMADVTWSRPGRSIASLVKLSDTIVIGQTVTLMGNKSWYRGQVTPIDVLKGAFPPQVHETLSWKPSATGLRPGSRHLFFLRRHDDRFEVLQEMYVFENPSDAMRTYAYLDGGREATLLVVRKLAGEPISDERLSRALMAEIQHKQLQRRQTGTLLAADLQGQASVLPLEQAIRDRDDYLPLAVYALEKVDPRRGVEAALNLIGGHPSVTRIVLAQVFDAMARTNRQEIIGPLAAFAGTRAEFQVSCAFVIAQLGKQGAIPLIASWRDAAKKDSAREMVNGQAIARSQLLDRAISFARDGALDPAHLPNHLLHFPGLSERMGERIVEARAADVAMARVYPRWSEKGLVAGGLRLTIMTAKREVAVAEEVRVIHVFEAVSPGHDVFVMGPKPVYEEYVDGKLASARYPGPDVYDGAVMKSPWADYNYEVTSYRFDRPGTHTIQWKGGDPSEESLGLESNVLTITVR